VSRISAREHWITEVLRGDLNNSVKLILVALGRQMDEKGRVRYPRERLAADVGPEDRPARHGPDQGSQGRRLPHR
jgi:hypothetical protein